MSDEDNLKPEIERLKSELESVRSNQKAELSGDGALAQGMGNKAVGREGILIEGNVYIGTPSKDQQKEDDLPTPGESPFKGLQYYDVADAPLFFGRTNLTNTLLEHIRTQRFLAVVGASGSGKSSVVRAGVVAALQGQPGWRTLIVTPTAHPLETLALALTSDSESVSAAKTLRDDMRGDPESLHLYARRLMTNDSKVRMLLVVDQFEELFTLCRDVAERDAYINNLLTATSDDTQGPLTIVITIRADFYHHCVPFQGLRTALETHQKIIGSMNQDELRQAIVSPAETNGWEFEPGLIDLMLRDVSEEPGALPLLSHALLATWQRRRRRTLTLAGYSEAGGVRGAIAKTAEDTYQRLTLGQQQIARSIFLRLTELGEGTQDTRRRVNLSELEPRLEAQKSEEQVLQLLTDARLVTTDKDSVEVAHEALIREWPTLRHWLDEDREALRVHRHLTESAQGWESNGRDAGDLYRGTRLVQALEWANAHPAEISLVEAEYLKSCRAEHRRERRAVQIRWASIITAIVFGLIVVVLGVTGQLNPYIYRPLSMEWITIPAGEFNMGSESGNSAPSQVHLVYLDAFEIGKYEVTNQQYLQCVKAGACSEPLNGEYKHTEKVKFPVKDVSWFDGDDFCKWNDSNGRLPTEAEWEKSARGTDGRTYPWGEGIDSTFANFNSNRSVPVGSYESGKSPYGVYDMAGNVWEWVADWYDPNYYKNSPTTNPTGPESGTVRALRGGSWGSPEKDLHSANRGRNLPSVAVNIFGFRCARDVSP